MLDRFVILCVSFWVFCLVFGQGLTVGTDYPVPRDYQIRYTRDGKPYAVVTSFDRVQTGVVLTPKAVGVVESVRSASNNRSVVALRAKNGITLKVRTGDKFLLGGRTFHADGFQGDHFQVTCLSTGQKYTFSR